MSAQCHQIRAEFAHVFTDEEMRIAFDDPHLGLRRQRREQLVLNLADPGVETRTLELARSQPGAPAAESFHVRPQADAEAGRQRERSQGEGLQSCSKGRDGTACAPL